MKKSFVMFLIVLVISIFLCGNSTSVYAEELFSHIADTEIYSVYDDDFNLLFEKDYVEVGDGYMSKDYKYYEISYVDDDKLYAIAKYVRTIERPKVDIDFHPTKINIDERKICMYMTHNDESYVPTDGVDSVYGNGGIKDVALAFKKQLEKYFVDVNFDDTLHIPHDYNAYARSSVTAKKLYNEHKPDAIFDIHRDGTSRSFYVTKVNGVEKGRVRMVVGKANPNMALNEEFAMYLMAVGNELYPWLFTDIFYANGHYNQELDGKALLFEMGSHLCEKELIIDSMDELAEVVTTAMYKTTVNKDTGDLTVNGDETVTDVIVKDIIDEKQEKIETSNNALLVCSIIIIAFAGVCSAFTVIFYKNYRKERKRQ